METLRCGHGCNHEGRLAPCPPSAQSDASGRKISEDVFWFAKQVGAGAADTCHHAPAGQAYCPNNELLQRAAPSIACTHTPLPLPLPFLLPASQPKDVLRYDLLKIPLVRRFLRSSLWPEDINFG